MITLLIQAIIIGGFCAGLGWLLSIAGKRWSPGQVELIAAIESRLPQTQCGQCQYPGCHAYAAAVAEGESIDLCPPGGESTLIELSNLLGRPARRRTLGETPIDLTETPAQVARIREPECVGCTVCLSVCPVDAIIGAQGFMHGVLEDQCTGCELCVPACPVDCIDLLERPKGSVSPRVLRKEPSLEPLGCIRCGRCDQVCPRDIPVRDLWWSIRQGLDTKLTGPRAEDCIACGLCDANCPSGISLATPILKQATRDRRRRELRRQAERAAELYDNTSLRRSQEITKAESRRRERLQRLGPGRTKQEDESP